MRFDKGGIVGELRMHEFDDHLHPRCNETCIIRSERALEALIGRLLTT